MSGVSTKAVLPFAGVGRKKALLLVGRDRGDLARLGILRLLKAIEVSKDTRSPGLWARFVDFVQADRAVLDATVGIAIAAFVLWWAS